MEIDRVGMIPTVEVTESADPSSTINARNEVHLGINISEKDDHGDKTTNHKTTIMINNHKLAPLESPVRKRRFSSTAGASAIYPAFSLKRKDSIEETEEQCLSVWQALREGNAKALDIMLTKEPNLVNEVDSSGNSLIMVAAKYNFISVAKILVGHKCDINGKCKPFDISPLHEAARHDSVDVGRLLIERGADVMSRDCKKKTPLHYAVRRGKEKMTELLLNSAKCDVNATDEDKLTSLHEAIMHRQENIVRLLVKHGANVLLADVNGSLPYQHAASEEMVDTMALIAQIASKNDGLLAETKMINNQDSEGNTALHWAIANVKEKAVQELIKVGASVNVVNDSRHAPLHVAATNGNVTIIKMLLNNGAKLSVRDKDYFTPIHRAAMYNKVEAIEEMMNKGGNINGRNREQLTPLMVACWKGHQQTVDFLIKNGAQISETDNRMRTALHWTVENNHLEILLNLINRCDASVLEVVDDFDQTLMHYASKLGNVTLIHTLLQQKCKVNVRDKDGKTPLHLAAEYDNSTAIEALINASKAELNDEDADGQTPLMTAAKSGNVRSVTELLSHGADISMRDENSSSALSIAAREGNCKILKILIDNYADIDDTDKLRNTPLHIAASKGYVECVQHLLCKKAKVTLKNSYGKTPLDLAIENRQTDVCTALMKNDQWGEMLATRNSDGMTPVDSMIEKCPASFLVVMDNCVEISNLRTDDPNFSRIYDFRLIDPGPDDVMSKNRRYNALEKMVEYKRTDLLSHPLSQNLLLMKWRRFGRVIFYLNISMYVLYLLFANLYISVMPNITTNLLDDVRGCPIILNETERQNQTLVDYYKKNGQSSDKYIDDPFITTGAAFLIITTIYFYLRELISLYSRRLQYFFIGWNYLTIIQLICTTYFLFPLYRVPCENEYRSGWIGLYIAWLCLMSFLREVNVIGIYFVMFQEVMISLLKVFPVLFLFLTAFSQVFAITMAQTTGFTPDSFYPWTIFSMMLGELNYIDNFVTSSNYPFTFDNYILIFIFFMCMPLALMNLLIGIAVGDIESVQKMAYLTKISVQIDNMCAIDNTLPKYVQRKLYKRTYKVLPNENLNSAYSKVYKFIFGKVPSQNFISADKPDETTERIKEIQHDLKITKYQVTQLQSIEKQTQDLLKQICDHLHVNYNVENVSVAESQRTEIISKM